MEKWKQRLIKFFRGFLVFLEILLVIVAITVLCVSVFISGKNPSMSLDWVPNQKVMPVAEFETGGKVLIRNVRNVSYKTVDDYTVGYYDREYDTNKLKKVWFALSPFTGEIGIAHAFLSFEFEDDKFVSISVEVRKEKGETYSPVNGLLRDYELIYVIGDERDVIRLRTDQYKDKVFLYPLKMDKEKGAELFRAMLMRANGLANTPEFYNTITSNCITNFIAPIDQIIPGLIPWNDHRVLLPEYLDQYFYELGLIDTNLSFEKAREKYLINDRVKKYADDPDFSRKIRGE